MPPKSKRVKKSPKLVKPVSKPEVPKIDLEADYEQLLINRISRAQTVINEVSEAPGWKIYLEDIQQKLQLVDANWHLTDDPKKVSELRVTKLAADYAYNVIRQYASDLEMAKKELKEFQNPKEHTQKDYDTEGIN